MGFDVDWSLPFHVQRLHHDEQDVCLRRELCRLVRSGRQGQDQRGILCAEAAVGMQWEEAAAATCMFNHASGCIFIPAIEFTFLGMCSNPVYTSEMKRGVQSLAG